MTTFDNTKQLSYKKDNSFRQIPRFDIKKLFFKTDCAFTITDLYTFKNAVKKVLFLFRGKINSHQLGTVYKKLRSLRPLKATKSFFRAGDASISIVPLLKLKNNFVDKKGIKKGITKFFTQFTSDLSFLVTLLASKYQIKRVFRLILGASTKTSLRQFHFFLQLAFKSLKKNEVLKSNSIYHRRLFTIRKVIFPLWKNLFSREVQQNIFMGNATNLLPGLHILTSQFYISLFSCYLQNLDVQQDEIYAFGLSRRKKNMYKQILNKYINLLQSFYKNYYAIKKAKTLPMHYGIYLVFKYLYLTGQLDIGFLNHRREQQSWPLKLVFVTRYINRKSGGVLRKKKNLFKLKTIFDRLFF